MLKGAHARSRQKHSLPEERGNNTPLAGQLTCLPISALNKTKLLNQNPLNEEIPWQMEIGARRPGLKTRQKLPLPEKRGNNTPLAGQLTRLPISAFNKTKLLNQNPSNEEVPRQIEVGAQMPCNQAPITVNL